MHVSSPVCIRKVENGGKYGREGRYDETAADNTGNIEGFMGGKEADIVEACHLSASALC